MNQDIIQIAKDKGYDLENLRINLGGGNTKYSNCLVLELQPHPDIDADIFGDIRSGLNFIPDNTFKEVLLIHVIEHLERNAHQAALDTIWRILKPNGRLVMGFPDIIENMKRFIENKFGARWTLYHPCIFGRQSRPGDYHISGIERQDITDKLLSAGFVDLKWLQYTINVTMTARKGEKLNGNI